MGGSNVGILKKWYLRNAIKFCVYISYSLIGAASIGTGAMGFLTFLLRVIVDMNDQSYLVFRAPGIAEYMKVSGNDGVGGVILWDWRRVTASVAMAAVRG